LTQTFLVSVTFGLGHGFCRAENSVQLGVNVQKRLREPLP